MTTEEKNAFVLRMTDHDRIPFGRARGLIGVGWGNAEGLSEIKDWARFKDVIRTAYNYTSERALGNCAGSLWRFVHDMKEGDVVLVPDGGSFHLCEVAGGIEYHAEYNDDAHDLGWCRKSKWLQTIQRNTVSNALQRRLKARQTSVWAGDLINDINAASQGLKREFASDVRKSARDIVRKALHDSINDVGLENLIADLLKKSGFRAQVMSKKGQVVGDIDVLATYDFAFGEIDATIQYGFQIKQHEGSTDVWAVEQIVEALAGHIDKGFVITTANTISDEAVKLAEENSVTVITENELVDWILMEGLEGISV